MTARLKIPRMLAETANTAVEHQVSGGSVGEILTSLFATIPGLRHHILDETGAIRPHVSVFVNGSQGGLETDVGAGADIRILHAVSGG